MRSHASEGIALRTSCCDDGAHGSHEALHGSHGAMLDPTAILLEDLDLPALDSLLQDAEQIHDQMDMSLWPETGPGWDSAAPPLALLSSPAVSSGGGSVSPSASAAVHGGPALAGGEAAGSPPLSDSESGPGRGSATAGGGRARSPDAAASQEHSSGSAGAADTRVSFRGSPGRSDSESLSPPGTGASSLPGAGVRDGGDSRHHVGQLPQMVPVGSGPLGPQQPPLSLSRQPSTATSTGAAPASQNATRGTKHARHEPAAKTPNVAAAAAEKEAAGQSSRPRKRQQNDELERRCQDLTIANTHLTGA